MTNPAGDDFRRGEATHSIPATIAACAAASALVPIHPSIQSLWIEAGLPSLLGVLMFLGPALLFFLFHPALSRYEVGVFLPFLGYAIWLLATSAYSPAIGMPNWWNSVRSLAVVLPAITLAACVAARNPSAAVRVVIGCGIAATVHYSYLLFAGKSGGDEASGFGAIAVIDGVPNYQATTYYMGILGVWALSLIKCRRAHLLPGLACLALAIALMSTAGARSALVGLVGLAVISLGVSRLKLLMGMMSLGLLLGIFMLASLSHFNYDVSAGEGFQGWAVVGRFLTLFEEGDSSHRLRLFSSALEMWLESPANLLFGGGLAAYPLFTGQADEAGWYPHNFVLESLAEGGLIAVLPLAIIMLRLLTGFWKNGRLQLQYVFMQYFAIYTFLAYMFMGGIDSVWIPCFALTMHFFTARYLVRR
jgi:O-antigen ligase